MHLVFFLCGFVVVAFVLVITIYLVISGLPAIRMIGLKEFLLGAVWDSTNKTDPKYGILPFLLTSVYGTAGAILLGVPVGFLTAVFLAKAAPTRLEAVLRPAVDLLAGIPSVVYGMVGMTVLLPAVREWFDLPAGDTLFAAIVVLAVMILPSIISVSENALRAVPREYEEASLALGATEAETWFRVTVSDNSGQMTEEAVSELNRRLKCGEMEESSALQNLSRRMELRYGQEYELKLESHHNGLRVSVTFPRKER